ncbi:histidine kinase [Flagellimonas okinawensis]|uniref:Histidine kinase n=1 Tax=Flagellimonas okinawensis TaxID=3031324 RepID=A0ABT5XLQ1_9FLAO|nr:histidine kinase [[Muricauda] okinawensis]MDF0706819.1 histidine kinase [[Muricauda] okinawensis]
MAITGKAALVRDTSKDPRYIENNIAGLSEICVPIICEDILYGVIDCEHPEKGFFTGRHLKLLSAIASICAIKIKSVRANKELIDKQAKLISINEEMLELKLSALNSHLNPHFVFNSLNAIQYFITTQNTKSALDYFSTFSRLIRFYLNQLGKDTTPLYNEIDTLHWYLKLQKLRYNDSFDYSISIDRPNNENKEATIPSFVVPMLFENIVEQSNKNNVTNQHFDISIAALKNIVKMEVKYQCKGLEKEELENDGYRADILKWNNQVELLNTVKGYNISHETSSFFKDGVHQKNIALELPNLVDQIL